MKRVGVFVVVTSATLAALFTAVQDRGVPTVVGVPAYGYPSENAMWSQFASIEAGAVLVVLNPASGPGASVDTIYLDALDSVRAAETSIEIYGYVDTDYGGRSVESVLADSAQYVEWYGTVGIFLDQTPSDPGSVAYLIDITEGLRQQGLQVAMNPGQPEFDLRLVDAVDFIVNFEGPVEQYEQTTFPGWVHEDRSKFWHLVYGVPDAPTMTAVLERAADNGANAVFVTDGLMPNPWSGLPPYWDDQVDHVLRR